MIEPTNMPHELPTTDHAVTLAGETLVLRPFRLQDANDIYEAVRQSLAELGQWLSWCHAGYALDDTLEFLRARPEAFRRDGEYSFAIVSRTSGEFLGATGINQIDPASRRANLGYWLRTSATGRGIATQATRMLALWAFEALELQRIEIVAAVGNLASQRVAERSGATREGIARNRLRVHGVPHDAVLYSLVPADFIGARPQA
jgi:RimJ/RimL family protein N-acetyltransferase